MSCSPTIYQSKTNSSSEKKMSNTEGAKMIDENYSQVTQEDKANPNNEIFLNTILNKKITLILPNYENEEVVEQFINVTEIAVYNKNLKDVEFEVIKFDDDNGLKEIINNQNNVGKIYIGPLSSKHTEIVKNYCNTGAVFFAFSSNVELAGDCVYLVNFFPENELKALFGYFPKNSKLAILYPENDYGYSINMMIDKIAFDSNSVIVNRASYKSDMSNVHEAIKELGKYELRKYELSRQKKILSSKKDEESIKRLKKLQKFKTTKDFDFTHVLIADYGLRLLQVAPLLPYYDIDPDVIHFVGTGVWDDPAFFDEPSLQNSIFPGVEIEKRKDLMDQYKKIYDSNPLRISTLPYDIIGLISYAFGEEQTLRNLYNLLDNPNIRFDGVDGSFYFNKNIIQRDLNILEILDGSALKIN